MTLYINQKEDFLKRKLKCEVALTSPVSFEQHVELPLGFEYINILSQLTLMGPVQRFPQPLDSKPQNA